MRTFISCALAVLMAINAFAQAGKGKVTVTVLNDQNTAIEGATAELFRSKDSSLARTAIADKSGLVEIEGVTPSTYLFRISAVGFAHTYSGSFEVKEGQTTTVPSIKMTAKITDQLQGVTPSTYLFRISTVGFAHTYSGSFEVKEGQTTTVPSIKMTAKITDQLQGVTVSTSKPFIQRLNDRLIVNVENSVVNAGSAAIDVLERSPGVTIDQNDNIILRGRSGVIVMIDGRVTPMTGADLANYLRGLPVNAIERIEIITNPSSKYDAAGNSGIIDIRLKKDQRLGSNGTVTIGYGQGVYPKWNAGNTFNYRNKSVNVFGNYNHSYRENLNHLIINRNFFDNGVFKGSDDKDNYAHMPFRSNTVRFGADFFPSKNTVLGFVVNGNYNSFSRVANIRTDVADRFSLPLFRFNSIGTNDDNFDNTVANINLKHKFDSTGRELTADVDYGVFNNTSLTRTASYFFNLNGSKRRSDDILDGDQRGKLTLKTAKVDYTNPLKGGGKLEAGLKTSYVSSDNDAKFYNVLPDETLVDEGKTNRFFYEEYNNAAYTNFSKEYKKFNVQVGLRGELTNLRTRQVKGDRRYNNDYFQLFPSAFFNYKLKQDQTLGVSVSRRIDRPGYQSLNPFLFQVDATIYSTGEPLLRPQTTWSYEMNYTLKNLNFSLGYSRTQNTQNMVLARILDVIPTFEIKPGQDSNITVQLPVNLGLSEYIGLTASAPVKVTKWWNMINNVNVFYNKFNGNISGAQLNAGAPAANIRTNNTFTFKKGWTTELNANLNTGGRYGYATFKTQWGLGAGMQKTIMEGKGTVRFNFTDIFWTNRPRAKVEYEGSYIENWHAFRESRVANLTFTYRFGNNKVQAVRRRTTSSEEERQRAGAN